MPPEPNSRSLSKLSLDDSMTSMTSEESASDTVAPTEVTPDILASGVPDALTLSATSWQEEEWEYDLGDAEGHEEEDGVSSDEEEEDDISTYRGLHIIQASVNGFTTVKCGNQVDFVYIVEVTWSDKTKHAVKRTYSDFQHFHYSLVEEYAKNCNSRNSEKSNPLKLGFYLPIEPHSRGDEISRAEQRELSLNQYVQELIKLPPKVSACPTVLTYFESRTSDPKPYKGPLTQSKEEQTNELTICWIQEDQNRGTTEAT